MKKTLSILLCCLLMTGLFFGCGTSDEVYIPTGDGLTWDEDYTGPTYSAQEEAQEQVLSLVYYKNTSMNPYYCTDFTNRALFSLIYQGLFTVDRDYNTEPMLCSRYTVSDDLTTYTFYVDEKATFSDGSPVTVQDVEATLRFARACNLYSGRFSKIAQIEVTEDGGLTVYMNTAYENLPLLLDIPILKADQLEDPAPLGSGPYIFFQSASGAQLVRRANWWCKSDLCLTATAIPLVEAESTNQIRDEFQFGDVELVQADPGSDRYAEYSSDYELWDAENGIFLYLVCRKDSSVFADDDVRRALTHAIDRDAIVQEYYRGFARSATLPCSPQFPYYNHTLASKYTYEPAKFSKAVSEAGMSGWPVTILVNSKDSMRVRIANTIADMLEKSGGLDVTVTATSGELYDYAVNLEEYDLILGQTKLSPNMDLSSFFTAYTSLSTGKLEDVECYTLCQQALENHGNYYSLHKAVMDKAYLCPISFRSYAVYATRGLLTDLTPSRDNVFYYSIGKTMEEAHIPT